MRLFRQPWLHFVLLGCALYALLGWWFPQPPPVIGPLGDARIESLRDQWRSAAGTNPTDAQLQAVIRDELDREMLYQHALSLKLHLYDTVIYQRLLRNMDFLQLMADGDEQQRYEAALEMGLHLGDEVIRRRLVQVMEQLLLAGSPPAEPTQAEVLAAFEQRTDELRRPPRYSLQHVFFSRDRDDLAVVVATIRDEQLSASAAREFSSPFLVGYEFRQQTPGQLARHFGAEFVSQLQQLSPQTGQWSGPVDSAFGRHLVYLEAFEPGRAATLAEVRDVLLRDLRRDARQQALQAAVAALRDNYEFRR